MRLCCLTAAIKPLRSLPQNQSVTNGKKNARRRQSAFAKSYGGIKAPGSLGGNALREGTTAAGDRGPQFRTAPIGAELKKNPPSAKGNRMTNDGTFRAT